MVGPIVAVAGVVRVVSVSSLADIRDALWIHPWK